MHIYAGAGELRRLFPSLIFSTVSNLILDQSGRSAGRRGCPKTRRATPCTARDGCASGIPLHPKRAAALLINVPRARAPNACDAPMAASCSRTHRNAFLLINPLQNILLLFGRLPSSYHKFASCNFFHPCAIRHSFVWIRVSRGF
jgi:hypothetical protein